ncbi:MAG: putative LPS assembly protein LptD [bacterium]|nr:putative LPS assembly protein LptD [bacterium]
MSLYAHQITINWDNDFVIAEGLPDTLWTDTSKVAIDTIVYFHTPLFLDRTYGRIDSLRGFRMEMNLKTQQGRVFTGTTANEQGKYYGQILKRVEPQVMYIRNGTFTTCDQNEPHYHFFSNKMKMIYKNKLIAQPVILAFGKVPTMFIPYGIFSLKPGRHSGLIVPSYGENTTQGRHFKHLGYYFAPNDYWDMKTTMDYYEKYGSLYNLEMRYVLRNRLQGGIAGNYSNQGNTNRWQIQWTHNQRIDPTFTVNANVLYINDASFVSYYSYDIADRLRQEVNSNISFSKNWIGSRASLSGGIRGSQVLQTKDYSLSMPSLTFRWSDGPIYKPKSSTIIRGFGGIDTLPSTNKKAAESNWWEVITYGYNFQLTNDESRTRVSINNPSSNIRKRQGAIHSLGINAPFKIFTHLSISPNVNITHDWSPQVLSYKLSSDSSQLKSEPIKGFFTRTTFRSRLGLNTKLYGVFDPKGAFGFTLIRHVFTPTMSFQYQPDFWDKKFGIVKRIYNPKTNRFLIGDPWVNTYNNATPQRKSMVFQFHLNNVFQGKYEILNVDRKEAEERKVDLFNWDLSTSYNLAADSLRWSDLNMSFRTSPYSGGSGLISTINFDLSTTHSFYQYKYYDVTNKRGNEINRFYWERKNAFPNFLRFKGARASLGFSWKKPQSQKNKGNENLVQEENSSNSFNITEQIIQSKNNDPYLGGNLLNQLREKPTFQPTETAWSGMTSLSFDYNLRNPMELIRSANLASSIQLKLTPSWDISYATSINLITREVASSGFTTHKDLHCWEIHFTWNPKGVRQGFYLRINVKSADLQDLKLERTKY